MIHGKKQEMFTTLQLLELAPFNFHLTGSRFMGSNRPEANWDFFAEDSLALVDWLKENNFHVTHAMQVEGRDELVEHWECGNCCVIVVKNLHHKLQIQAHLKPVFLEGYPGKEFARLLWKQATKLYYSQVETMCGG